MFITCFTRCIKAPFTRPYFEDPIDRVHWSTLRLLWWRRPVTCHVYPPTALEPPVLAQLVTPKWWKRTWEYIFIAIMTKRRTVYLETLCDNNILFQAPGDSKWIWGRTRSYDLWVCADLVSNSLNFKRMLVFPCAPRHACTYSRQQHPSSYRLRLTARTVMSCAGLSQVLQPCDHLTSFFFYLENFDKYHYLSDTISCVACTSTYRSLLTEWCCSTLAILCLEPRVPEHILQKWPPPPLALRKVERDRHCTPFQIKVLGKQKRLDCVIRP